MASSRTDLVVGLVLLGGFYGVEWMVQRRPRTRVERFATDAKGAGHAVRLGSVALFRMALADPALLAASRLRP
jgi:hypothetical protein